jgi:hypothetical protein
MQSGKMVRLRSPPSLFTCDISDKTNCLCIDLGAEASTFLNASGIGLRQLLESGSHLTTENVPNDRVAVGGPGCISPMRYQPPGELSLSYLASGSRRRWVVVGPNSKEKLENKLRRSCPSYTCLTRPLPYYLILRYVERF